MIWAAGENVEFLQKTKELELVWHDILKATYTSEGDILKVLLAKLIYNAEHVRRIQDYARTTIQQIRSSKLKQLSIEGFLKTHNLNSQEGLALMCLAEALLRIPDAQTKTQLIRDKVASTSWQNQDDDLLLKKFANLGLMNTSKFLSMGYQKGPISLIASLIRRFGEPLIRQIMVQAVRIIAQQFVMGETIQKALSRALETEKKGNTRHSYDMLGEAAKTKEDAARYFESYKLACVEIGNSINDGTATQTYKHSNPSLSVKLSAIHPRYEMAQRKRVMDELVPRVLELALLAKENNIGLTIDAEEASRLTLSLEVFHKVYTDPTLEDFEGLGLAVQAYQKRAIFIVRWIIALATEYKRRIPLRLVKGAYWDSEIKYAQVHGLPDYTVFTQKYHTDVSYLAAAKVMLQSTEAVYPQFATHNAFTVAAILELAKMHNVTSFEFQRLHGMGDDLYEQITNSPYSDHASGGCPCRVYAPVGTHRSLLAYLVRRLLENGANSSFVKQIHDAHISIEQMVVDPLQAARQNEGHSHPKIVLPSLLFKDRPNSKGFDLNSEIDLAMLNEHISARTQNKNVPAVEEQNFDQDSVLYRLVDSCHLTFATWSKVLVQERARIIGNFGDIMQHNMPALMNALVNEGRKTLGDAINEVREAIDFCHYYAANAVKMQQAPEVLPGPTGESNLLSYHPRGVMLSISPWNFPLAIFVGQAVGALVTGNCVVAKPATQTVGVAQMAVEMAYAAGVPTGALVLVNASRYRISDVVLAHPKIAGVVFTGSTESARKINQQLAKRSGPILPFIAETGGINAMIVDSSALLEQVVSDVISSAFQSAGQRCSALRILCVQNDIADSLLEMLIGALNELKVGDPHMLSTDIGPVIDAAAKAQVMEYVDDLKAAPERARLLYGYQLPEDLKGNFMSPHIFQVNCISDIQTEVFGPILHVVRYRGEYLDRVINDINALGYGLTLGVHTRLESTMQMVMTRAHVGNVYINRSMIGAVVGVQPFGGEGLSGTGFKAGGPNYLLKFVTERVHTQDTTAAGGNASLVTST
ncbi:MAG: bifunctional proline dehydrogenase/L-glutamate gamma-semialdehyde dehydrogenase PutA [Candidatus Paracaedibacteraceae bacterium]|nr:bifunctional proline dehydrogenase/L-glutamate gamma-semialdehyde dehydrogenase PutA [Candidatus Paracaedibacteraceae bacterium]